MRPLVLVLCLVSTLSALAQQATRYRLERIVVENSNISEDIVRGESRLEEEQSYTEEDFRQALYRIRRLPFVTDAVYRIEPGVTPGGTALVIRILDVPPAFYEIGVDSRKTEEDTETAVYGILGGRWLLDNLGVFEGGIRDGKDEDGILAGIAYRAYDIYGTGGYATGAIAYRFNADILRYDPEATILLGYPLTRRQSVELRGSQTKSRFQREVDVLGDDDDDEDDDTDLDDNVDLVDRSKFRFLELRWLFESTDDPFFPTRGMTLSGGPRWLDSSQTVELIGDSGSDDPIIQLVDDQFAIGVAFNADVYRTLFGRNVGFLRLDGTASRNQENDVDLFDARTRIGLAHDFHSDSTSVLRPWKARLEANGGYSSARRDSPVIPKISENTPFAEAAFLLRHRWGTVRVTGSYVFD